MNKKYISLTLAVAVIGTMVATPTFAMARVADTDTTTSKVSETFCSRLASYNAAKETKIAELENKLSAKRTEQEGLFEKRHAERDNKLIEKRTDLDSRRVTGYEKLLGKATTDEQKAAVEKFQLSVEAAVVVRRAAIDVAITNYRTGLDKAITDRKAGMDAALATYKVTIKAVENKAVADCAAGVESATVRTDLKSSIEAARDKFKTDRAAVVKVSDQVKALNAVRKAAFDKAIADFKMAVESAKNELKTVFPVKPSATSTPSATVE
ncbi:MAG: hypothetical protein NTW66_00640 [Candidatus Magasanikbacteria bacterium]|nr:hypothetical protein [Candidatus Magasanikbacteria bacterium]